MQGIKLTAVFVHINQKYKLPKFICSQIEDNLLSAY